MFAQLLCYCRADRHCSFCVAGGGCAGCSPGSAAGAGGAWSAKEAAARRRGSRASGECSAGVKDTGIPCERMHVTILACCPHRCKQTANNILVVHRLRHWPLVDGAPRFRLALTPGSSTPAVAQRLGQRLVRTSALSPLPMAALSRWVTTRRSCR